MVEPCVVPMDAVLFHPQSVAIVGFKPGRRYKRHVALTNTGVEAISVGVLLHKSLDFAFSPSDIVVLETNAVAYFDIKFAPKSLRYYADYLEFEFGKRDVKRVTVRAYPAMAIGLPRVVSFLNTSIGDSATKEFLITNPHSTDFACNVSVHCNQPEFRDFDVSPVGLISFPRHTSQRLKITYSPTVRATLSMYIKLEPRWKTFPGYPEVVTVTGFSTVFRELSNVEDQGRLHVKKLHEAEQKRLFSKERNCPVNKRYYKSVTYSEKLLQNAKLLNDTKAQQEKGPKWVRKYYNQQKAHRNQKHRQQMGYKKQAEMPTEQRKAVLKSLLDTVDEALVHPDYKRREAIKAWLKTQLPKDPQIQVALNTPLVPAHFRPLPSMVSPVSPSSVNSTFAMDFVIDFIGSITAKGIQIATAVELFPELRRVFELVETAYKNSTVPKESDIVADDIKSTATSRTGKG